MKLYRILSAAPYFVGTQAEAKRDAKPYGWKWELVDVPVDKDGLISFLNSQAILLVSIPEEAEPAPAEVHPAVVPQITTLMVTDWVLNEATVAQVENIFSCLGTRFKEQVRRDH